MGARGPKKTPLALVKARGNPAKRTLPPETIAPPVDDAMPAAPAHLSASARAEWKRLCPALRTLGLLSTLDHAAFAAYCAAYGRWVDCERALAKEKGNVTLPSGTKLVKHPLVSVAHEAMRDMVRIAGEFGMTPAARARIDTDAASGGKQGNPFDAFRKAS